MTYDEFVTHVKKDVENIMEHSDIYKKKLKIMRKEQERRKFRYSSLILYQNANNTIYN